MAFPGIKDAGERANVIAYLSTLSSSPVPFPAPAAEGAADEGAADEGAAPAEGGDAAAPAEAPAVETPATEPNAVETPTLTQDETAVEGTPAPAETPAEPAAQ